MFLLVLILLGLLVQGARIDEPETLHSHPTGPVQDALLLDDESGAEMEAKPSSKRKKS